MTADGEPILDFADRAAREGFQTISLRTEPMTPALAARVMPRLSEQAGFSPQMIASPLAALSPAPAPRVRSAVGPPSVPLAHPVAPAPLRLPPVGCALAPLAQTVALAPECGARVGLALTRFV